MVVKDSVSQHLPHGLGFRVFNYKYGLSGLLLTHTTLRSMDEFGFFDLDSCVKLSNKNSIFGLYIGINVFTSPMFGVVNMHVAVVGKCT